MRIILLIFLQLSLFSADFDCVVVGTSPFSLFEALYQHGLGKKILILEESSECGGAWKSIQVCGVRYVDMGCHQIGHDTNLKSFLKEYAGCKMVSLDNPLSEFERSNSPNGYYFSKGCFELVDNLCTLIEKTDITLLLNHKMEEISLDPSRTFATIKTHDHTFTTSKVILTPMTCCKVDSHQMTTTESNYYHLYLLLEDPNPPLFTYSLGTIPHTSRLMNLTPFLTDLTNSGRQLIIIQTHNQLQLNHPERFLEEMKEKKLISPTAYLLDFQVYIYQAKHLNQGAIIQLKAGDLIEILQTGHIQSLTNYIPKWKTILKPFREALE